MHIGSRQHHSLPQTCGRLICCGFASCKCVGCKTAAGIATQVCFSMELYRGDPVLNVIPETPPLHFFFWGGGIFRSESLLLRFVGCFSMQPLPLPSCAPRSIIMGAKIEIGLWWWGQCHYLDFSNYFWTPRQTVLFVQETLKHFFLIGFGHRENAQLIILIFLGIWPLPF